MARTVKVLSIDGGGIRGLIPAMVLEELERRTGRRIAEQFDLIAGASTGGVIALLLTRPGPDGRPLYPASRIVELYTVDGKDLFSSPPDYCARWKEKQEIPQYPADSVRATLAKYFADAQVKDAVTEVFVTAYDIDQRADRYLGRAAARDPRQNFYMRDLAQATSAFPGMFPPAEIRSVDGSVTCHLIDGGVFGANPSVAAVAHGVRTYGRAASFVVVSLGTGDYQAPIPWDQAKDWGFAQWGGTGALVGVMFDATTHAADITLATVFDLEGYYRFQIRLPKANDGTDNVDPTNIATLQRLVTDAFEGKPSVDTGGSLWPNLVSDVAMRLMQA